MRNRHENAVSDFVWRVAGRTSFAPPVDDWREQLAARLGQRPRRIGTLAELALYGALRCLDDAQLQKLPGDAVLRINSLKGADTAIRQILEQGRKELPMPFTFLQSQTSQVLPVLARALDWQGDGCVVAMRDPVAMATIACREAGHAGVLLGWVEEQPLRSDWLWLAPCEEPDNEFSPAEDFAKLVVAHYWCLNDSGIGLAG